MKHRILFFFLSGFLSTYLNAQSNFIGSGIALQFSGDDLEYVDAGDFYDSLNYPFTVETWINVNSFTSPYSCIFASDNPSSNYFGFWFQLNSTGCLRLELGDGSGAGYSDRKGKQTTSAVPLNEWVHVAVICNSSTDIHFYMNGVEKSSVATDGTGSVPSITHNSDNARIGNLDTPFDYHPFNGQIDEIRLWNNARTELELRDNMCHKMTGEESNLIGYWNCDESYVTTSIEDMSITGADASFVGAVEKINSGAPIGDESINTYTNDWTGVKLILASPGGDKFNLNKVINNPYGVQLYRVDSTPFYTDGLSTSPGYYYGVFTANSAVAAKYNISYKYSFANGVVSPGNETDSRIFVKFDDASSLWNDLDALPNYPDNSLIKKNINSRNEYIFNIDEVIGGKSDANGNKAMLELFPNPAADFIKISNVAENDRIVILGINGDVIFDQSAISNFNYYDIDISQFPSGFYILNLVNNQATQTIKFVKSN